MSRDNPFQPTRYERVLYRPAEGKRAISVYLLEPEEAVGGGYLVGVQVDRDGSRSGTAQVNRVLQVIAIELIVKRERVAMSKNYACLQAVKS